MYGSIARLTLLPCLLLSLAVQGGGAQQPSAAGSAAACTDPALPETGPLKMRTRVLYAVAELGHRIPDTTRLYATYLLDEFAREFRYPTPVAFTAWASADSFTTNAAIPALALEAMVVIRSNGQLRSVSFTQSSLVPAIDAAVDTAIRKAVQGGAIPLPSSLRIRNDITLYVALTFEPALDLLPSSPDVPPSQTRPLTPARRIVHKPLLRLQLPTARFSSPPRPDVKSSKRVLFPSDLLALGKDGDVTVQYVVGRDGRVSPGTVRLVGATERGFADRVFRTLKDRRYFPAEIGACPVPVLVTESISFRIDRR